MHKLVIISSICVLVLSLVGMTEASAQSIHVRTHSLNNQWDAPYVLSDIDSIVTRDKAANMLYYMHNGVNVTVPTSELDDLSIEEDPADETHDHYKVFQLFVTTKDGAAIDSKEEYTPCYVSLNGMGSYANRSASAGIRLRGNSSREWYDKKPYRIKFDSKQKMLGLGKAKSWVLLANYRDVTDLMNTFVFEAGKWLSMPFNNHTRYVELFINNVYKGLYQLTEQVQQGSNRVEIDDSKGILLSLDVDDGPSEAYGATDNFWSSVYSMPTTVKYPEDEDLTTERKQQIKDEFAILEKAISDQDYALCDSLMDIKSYMHYLMLQELVENVELVAPRSVYLFKDADTINADGSITPAKWTLGPLWDFDAGYDFDWSNMYTGHNYFSDYTELVLGTDPAKKTSCYDRSIPAFFTNLFGCKEFVEEYKAEWSRIQDSIVTHSWAECEKYLTNLRQGAMTRDLKQWPISGKNFETEVSSMKTWLTNRARYLGWVISTYSTPSGPSTPTESEQMCGTLTVKTSMQRSLGYSQNNDVVIDENALCSLLGVTDFDESKVKQIVPLDANGNVGANNTNGTYGAWFASDGTPGFWSEGHTYIEIYEDLLNWSCGLHPDNCTRDRSHTVYMQIQYADGTVLKKVNVKVTFSIR